MRRTTSSIRRLDLERLEDRFCPSLNEQFISGTLILSGFPNATPAAALTITRVPGGTLALKVQDGGVNLGTFNVTNDLRLNLNRYNTNITVDFNGTVGVNGVLGGNLVLNLGRGNSPASAGLNKISLGGGAVGGSVLEQGGSGSETLQIGSADSPVFGAPTTLKVGSDLRVSNGHGGALGNNLAILGGSAIGGNVVTRGVDSVLVGLANPARVGGNVQASDTDSSLPLQLTLTAGSTVGGSLAVQAPFGNLGGNIVALDAGTVVGGNVSATLGHGLNSVSLDGTVLGTATITGGNGTTAIAGIPVNLVEVSGTVGNLNVNLGNADSSVPGSFGNDFAFSPAGTVLGNLNITMGNGSNTLDGDDLGLTNFGGTVFGNVNINLGNGTNKFTFAGNVGGPTLSYTGGHGANAVTLDTAPGNTNTFAFNVRLGAGGKNTVTYTPAATAGSAFIDFGVPGPNNSFVSTAPITWPNTIVNY